MTTSQNATCGLCVVTVRLTARQLKALQKLGGGTWVRTRLASVAKRQGVPTPVPAATGQVSENEVMVRTSLRIPSEHRAIYDFIGGSAWLRKCLNSCIERGTA